MKVDFGGSFGRRVKHCIEGGLVFWNLIDGGDVMVVESGYFNFRFVVSQVFK